MNLEVKRDVLWHTLRSASAASKRSTAIPAYSCVKLKTQGTVLRIETTDGQSRYLKHIDCTVETPGQVFVPVDRLTMLVEDKLSDTVSLVMEEERLVVRNGAHMATLPTLPAGDDWPVWRDEAPAQELDGVVLADLAKVAFVTKADHDIFSGVYVQEDWVVAVDNPRMAALHRPGKREPVLIHRDTITRAVKAMGGDARLLPERNTVGFTHPTEGYFSSRVMAAKFPAWQNLIPDMDYVGISMPRVDMMQAIERAESTVSFDDTLPYVTLEPDEGGLLVTARYLGAKSTEVVPLMAPLSGDWGFQLHMMTKHFREALRACSEDVVELRVYSATKPVVIKEGDLVLAVMPVRK